MNDKKLTSDINENEYNERYAIEPTVQYRHPRNPNISYSVTYNKVSIIYLTNIQKMISL